MVALMSMYRRVTTPREPSRPIGRSFLGLTTCHKGMAGMKLHMLSTSVESFHLCSSAKASYMLAMDKKRQCTGRMTTDGNFSESSPSRNY